MSKRPTRATKTTAAKAEATVAPEASKVVRATKPAAAAKATAPKAAVETTPVALVIPPAEVDLRSAADRSDEIARAAYLLWEQGTPGSDVDLWLAAERSLLMA